MTDKEQPDQTVSLNEIVQALDSFECGMLLGSFNIARKASKYIDDKFREVEKDD